VSNIANTAATWQVNGVTGGNNTLGTINTSGVYSPPANIPTSNTVTVTAVSVATPSISGSTQVSILNPIPAITAATATPVSGTSYALEVDGTGFVTGAQIQVGGSSVTTTLVSQTDLQATLTIPSGTTTLSVDVMNPNPGSMASNAVSPTIYLRGHNSRGSAPAGSSDLWSDNQ
jgi:hypothetical protein